MRRSSTWPRPERLRLLHSGGLAPALRSPKTHRVTAQARRYCRMTVVRRRRRAEAARARRRARRGWHRAGGSRSWRHACDLHERRAAGLHGGMQFTYRNPDRSTDPSRARAARASIVVRRTRVSRQRATVRQPATDSRAARSRRTPRADHYATLRRGLSVIARSPARRRLRKRVCSPTTTRSSTARPRTAPGSAGTARTPTCCCPAAELVRARLGGHRRAARPTTRRWRTAAARAGAASTAARPAPSSRPAWSTPAAAWPGCCRAAATSRASTGSRSATASTAATTARRCARRTSDAAIVMPGRDRRDAVGVDPRAARAPTTPRCSLVTAAGTSPTATRATCAATPSSCSATSATRRTRRSSSSLERYLDDADPMLRAHAAWAARRLGPRTTCSAARAADPAIAAELADAGARRRR